LRDLIHCPNSSNEIFYVHNSEIHRMQADKRHDTVVREVGFTPTCFTAAYVAARQAPA